MQNCVVILIHFADFWSCAIHTFPLAKTLHTVSWALRTSRTIPRVGISTCWPGLHRSGLGSKQEDCCFLILWNSISGSTQPLVSLHHIVEWLMQDNHTCTKMYLPLSTHMCCTYSTPGDKGACSNPSNWSCSGAGSEEVQQGGRGAPPGTVQQGQRLVASCMQQNSKQKFEVH